jgi:hypothetical protein
MLLKNLFLGLTPGKQKIIAALGKKGQNHTIATMKQAGPSSQNFIL